MRAQLWVLVLAGALACKDKKKSDPAPLPPPAGDAAVAVAVDAAVAIEVDAAVAIDAAAASGIVVREDGVTPFKAKDKITVDAMKKLLPDFEAKALVVKYDDLTNDESVALSKAGKLAVKVYPEQGPRGSSNMGNQLHSVEVLIDVENPWGLKIGMTHADFEKVMAPTSCQDAGVHDDLRQHQMSCSSKKAKRYDFLFELNGQKAGEFSADPKKIGQSKLVGMRWSP